MASTGGTQAGSFTPTSSITISTNSNVAASRTLPVRSKIHEPQDQASHENENEKNLKSAKERKYESLQSHCSDNYRSEA